MCEDLHDSASYNCKDTHSPVFEDCVKNLTTPDDAVKSKCLTKKDENKLMERMEAALSIIENTPRTGAVKKKFPLKSCNRQIWKTTSNVKPTQVRPSALSRSKSIAALNKIADKSNKVKKGLRKRSSSLNDLRTKKHTYPLTPMCLKRTIVKAKAKVAKSTEEMELEEIAKLQKQLIQHLRYNEISMKRLRLKPRVCINQKTAQPKLENLKENKAVEKAFNPFLEKNNVQKEYRDKMVPSQRQNIPTLSHAAVKKVALKMESIMANKMASNSASHKMAKENLPSTSKYPSVVSSSVSEVNEEDKAHGRKKPVNAGKMHGFHSGLLFAENVKKITIVKPFNFHNKAKEVNVPQAPAEVDTGLSSSEMNPKIGDGKENIQVIKVQPNLIKSTKGIQSSSRFDFSKLPGSNKRENRNMNRGLHLSENFARN